jgi:hypothetical protein
MSLRYNRYKLLRYNRYKVKSGIHTGLGFGNNWQHLVNSLSQVRDLFKTVLYIPSPQFYLTNPSPTKQDCNFKEG